MSGHLYVRVMIYDVEDRSQSGNVIIFAALHGTFASKSEGGDAGLFEIGGDVSR
jgi:hypothetical protein